MTHHIRQEGGVVGDFQGDAAMGFWGWPLPQKDAVLRTCRAALAVRAEFEATAGFHAGIGVATGRAVAGKIGTVDQVKVTVFGPVVNLASRLEGMTKIASRADPAGRSHRPDRPPAGAARGGPGAAAGDRPALRARHAAGSERAAAARLAISRADRRAPGILRSGARRLPRSGRWPTAFELLHRIPAEDQVKDFLVGLHRPAQPPAAAGLGRGDSVGEQVRIGRRTASALMYSSRSA